MNRRPEFFVVGNTMYHVSQILMLEVDGGPYGHGCWGTMLLKGMDKPITIGDGSYALDAHHVVHKVAQRRRCSVTGSTADFGFQRLRRIMRIYGLQAERKRS